jgi:phasin family protein
MKIDGIDTFVALGKDNADAMVKSGTAAMKGFEEMAKAGQALAAHQAATLDAAFKALFACKSPIELADLQGKLARESIETAIAEGRKFAELATTTYTAALEPLNGRVAAFQALAKSAA